MNGRCFQFLRLHVFSTFWINQCRYVSPIRSDEIMLGQRFMLKETKRRVYWQIVSFGVSGSKGAAISLKRGLFKAIHKANLVACRVTTTSLSGCGFKAKQQLCTSYIIPLDWIIHNVILFKKRVQRNTLLGGKSDWWKKPQGVKGDGNCQWQ